MGYREDMIRCRTYIDTHCAEDLTAAGLAKTFGYSMFHFCHVFKSCNEMSVGEYIRESRLSRAANEIVNGKSITKAAMDAGFDTSSGFNRAFHRKFGMNPTKYKKMKGSIASMTPEIKKMSALTAVGYTFPSPEKEPDLLDAGAYWLGKDFSGVSLEDYKKLTYPGYAEIGTWLHPSEQTGEFCYFLGPTTKDKSFVPQGMTALDIPAAEYAVFRVPVADDKKALSENIKQTWKYIFNEWFDGSTYKFDHRAMDFEYYCGADTSIYVPIVKK